MVSHLKFWSHNLHSWCDRIVVLGFSVLFFSQFECKVIQSSHNLVNPSLWILSLRISHIWRFWVLEDLESSTKKNSVKISSQFLKFSVFRAQFSGSHFGNSQFRSEIPYITLRYLPHPLDPALKAPRASVFAAIRLLRNDNVSFICLWSHFFISYGLATIKWRTWKSRSVPPAKVSVPQR